MLSCGFRGHVVGRSLTRSSIAAPRVASDESVLLMQDRQRGNRVSVGNGKHCNAQMRFIVDISVYEYISC